MMRRIGMLSTALAVVMLGFAYLFEFTKKRDKAEKEET